MRSRGLPLTIRTGESQLIPEVTDDMLEVGALAQDEEHERVLRALGFRSAIVVPLRARGRILGAIGLALGDDTTRRFGPEDLTYAEDLAAARRSRSTTRASSPNASRSRRSFSGRATSSTPSSPAWPTASPPRPRTAA